MTECKQCAALKEDSEFHWQDQSRGIRKTTCKSCRSTAKPKEWSDGRVCNQCGKYKHSDEFSKHPTGAPIATCKPCRKVKYYLQRHPEISIGDVRSCNSCRQVKFVGEFPRRKMHLDICKTCLTEQDINPVYSITNHRIQEIFAEQDGRCSICDRMFKPGKMDNYHIDHDHDCCPGQSSCGKCVRGLLCHHCNVGLGNFKDDIDRMKRAIAYLERYA